MSTEPKSPGIEEILAGLVDTISDLVTLTADLTNRVTELEANR